MRLHSWRQSMHSLAAAAWLLGACGRAGAACSTQGRAIQQQALPSAVEPAVTESSSSKPLLARALGAGPRCGMPE